MDAAVRARGPHGAHPLFPDVASLPLRPPVVLAKAAASLDRVSGGRFELGLGAGAVWDAIAAMGGPRRDPGEAVSALAEAIEVIRLMWSGERGLRFDGEHYRLGGVHSGPQPAHDIGIWLGAYGPRMLALTGRAADGWVPSSGYLPPDRLQRAQDRIDQAAVDAGREPDAVLRLYNMFGTVTAHGSDGLFDGPVDQWVDRHPHRPGCRQRHRRVRARAGDGEDEEVQLRRFATEVAPAVRTLVAGARDDA